jgi:GTPase SAR1 family protein
VPWVLVRVNFVTGVLIANKIDLDKRRVVSEADGRAFAIANELEYFECSAVSHMTIT